MNYGSITTKSNNHHNTISLATFKAQTGCNDLFTTN